MRRPCLFGLFLVAVLCAGASARDDAVVCAGLNDVMAQPRAYLKTTFQFEGRFAGLGEIYQPFFTVFDEFVHANFAAWDAQNDLRAADQYAQKCSLLYLARRSGKQIENMFGLKRYQRFRATAVVQSIFGGRPFIEVIDLVPLDTHYSAETHLRAAFGLAPPPRKPWCPWLSCRAEARAPAQHDAVAAAPPAAAAAARREETALARAD
ncbi:MAG: hypothetical protein HY812_04735 [Planctomycetes bacterium]|nr:hypothetical protein [Planctomycetota bacterium]